MFSRSDNRVRHEQQFHGGEETMSEVSEVTQNTEENNQTDQEMDENEENEEEETEEEDDNEENEDYDEEMCWKEILEESAEDGYMTEHPERYLTDPYLGAIVERIKNVVQQKLKIAHYLEDDDGTYREIKETIERYENQGCLDDEAVEKAWSERRFLIKKKIKEHLDVFRPEDDDEDNDDNDEDNVEFESDDTVGMRKV